MRDLNDRTKVLLQGWKEAGICIECFRDLKGDVVGAPQEHAEWCQEKE